MKSDHAISAQSILRKAHDDCALQSNDRLTNVQCCCDFWVEHQASPRRRRSERHGVVPGTDPDDSSADGSGPSDRLSFDDVEEDKKVKRQGQRIVLCLFERGRGSRWAAACYHQPAHLHILRVLDIDHPSFSAHLDTFLELVGSAQAMSQHSPSSPNTGNEAHIQLQLSLDDFGSEDGSKDAHGSADVDYETSFAAIMGSSPRAPRSNGNGNSAVNGDYHGQGREDGDEEEEEEGFFYSGVDRQAGILDDENEDADVDADVDADADAQSEAYSAQMRSILGSDAASEENVGQDEEEDADESFTYPAPPSHSVGDASFATDSALPDISFDGPEYQAALSPSATGSLGALSPATARGSVGARPDYFSPSPSPSLALSRSSSMFGAPDSRPRRPATYPSINRLRSSFARQPSFGTERSLSSAGIGGGFFPFATPKAGATATPSLRSRASSASGSALPPRMFPYSTSSQGNGPTRTVEGTVLAPSPAVASETGAAASPIPAGGSASSSSGPAQQDFLRWSSLRKIANNMYPPPGRTPLGRAAGLGEPTVLAVAGGLIAVGTTRGRTMVFEYSQELKCVCGTDIIGECSV